MKKSSITRLSMDDIKAMKARGEVIVRPDAQPGPSLGKEFWASAKLVEPKTSQPVLLKVDSEVLDFFKSQGKGHLTRMQNVLKAYVAAQKQA